ncbi:MAG: hypothetical protein R2778_07915 [Saprospiraceae bacterium]
MSIEVYINGSRIKDELNLISIDVDRSLSRIPTAALTFQLHAEDVRKRSRVLGQSKGYIPGAEIVIKAGYEGNGSIPFSKGSSSIKESMLGVAGKAAWCSAAVIRPY